MYETLGSPLTSHHHSSVSTKVRRLAVPEVRLRRLQVVAFLSPAHVVASRGVLSARRRRGCEVCSAWRVVGQTQHRRAARTRVSVHGGESPLGLAERDGLQPVALGTGSDQVPVGGPQRRELEAGHGLVVVQGAVRSNECVELSLELLQPSRGPLLLSMVLCGICHFTYNLLSFEILSRTSPVTHVVLHALRRILVIAASSALNGQAITLLNWSGIAIASAGVLSYALASSASASSSGSSGDDNE